MSEAGGAAFNAAVRTEDNAPEPPERDDEQQDTEAEDGQVRGEDQE